jgi:hypothetical protein
LGLRRQWNGDKGQIDLNNSWEEKQQVAQLFFVQSRFESCRNYLLAMKSFRSVKDKKKEKSQTVV